MAGRQKTKEKAASQPSVAWWMRWTNTALVTLLPPFCLVGTVYLLLFFILNSSYGPKILHGQLGCFLRGDYFAETMRTDALLRDLTMTNVRLSEAGKSEAVVFAPVVVAKIPMEELFDLVTDLTLRVGRIHAYDAEVTLDFSHGELNILKVVLPYFSEAEPPEPPGNFITFLEDLNVSNTKVHLIFDGFRIDLSGVEVDHYGIRTGGGNLVMTSPKAVDNGGLRAIRVATTVLEFDPLLFGFPLASVGPQSEGLVLSGASGQAGKMGFAYRESAKVLAQAFDRSVSDRNGDSISRNLDDGDEYGKGSRGNLDDSDEYGDGTSRDLDGGDGKDNSERRYGGDARRVALEVLAQLGISEGEVFASLSEDSARGHFIIPLKDTFVDGFNWQGDTMYIPAMDSSLGEDGSISLRNGMMNTSPKQSDIDRMTSETGHRPSGLLPEESILWSASIDMRLGVEDPILEYFFGSVLHGEEAFRLMASMRGDLARVSGDISLDMPEFETFDIDIVRASLKARMDGQRVDLHALEIDTDFGGVGVSGFYEIFDGNFAADVWLGMAPEAGVFDYIDDAFEERLSEGLAPLEFLPDGAIKRLNGLLRAHLRAESNEGAIEVSLPSALSYRLDEPVLDISAVTITPVSKKTNVVFKYADGLLASPAGLNVDLGTDYVRVAPKLSIDLERLLSSSAGVVAHIERPRLYAQYLGIDDLESGPIDVDVSYGTCGSKACGHVVAKTNDVSYFGIDIPKIDIDLQIEQSILKTRKFRIDTEIGTVSAELGAKIVDDIVDDPTKVPFNALVRFEGIDFGAIPFDKVQSLGIEGRGRGVVRVTGPVDDIAANLHFSVDHASVYDVDMSRISLHAIYEKGQALIPSLNIWFRDLDKYDKSEDVIKGADRGIELRDAADLRQARQARQARVGMESGDASVPSGEQAGNETSSGKRDLTGNRRLTMAMGRPDRAPDFALTALTYDIAKNSVVFNVALNPVSPNDFKPFRELGLPLTGKVGFDLAANIDFDQVLTLMAGKPLSAKQTKSADEATWIEGGIDLIGVEYDGMHLGNTQIEFSRSSQYALLRGNIIDMLDLSGFVRTSPRLSASISLNFPDLDVFDALERLGIDISGLKKSFNMRQGRVSGSIGLCMRSLDEIQVSVLLDDIAMLVYGYPLSLTQPAFIRADLKTMELKVNQLELKYRDSVLKLSGSGDVNGNVDVDINGEIDAAVARSVIDAIEASSGLLGINLSAHGNIFDGDKISLNRMKIDGYLGVRDPIQLKTSLSTSPFEISKGFFLIGNDHALCGHREICIYTPENQPFTFGINDQWLELSLFAGALGYANVQLDGKIDMAVAQLFVKDIASAQGRVDFNAQVSGRFLDKRGNLSVDANQFNIEGHVGVESPIALELRSLNDPIIVNDGILKITEGEACPSHKQCIVIPEDRAFSGSVMGGNYRITGEIVRDVVVPKSGYVSLTATNIGFRMKDELSLTLSPDLMVTVKDFANFETVKVSGDIDVADATYRKNFDDGSSNFIKEQILSMFVDSRRRVATYSPSFLRKMPELGKIQFDVGVNAENSISVDVRIAGATVNLELGTQARIGGTITDIAPTGIFSINSGVFSMKGNDFDFQNGSQIAFSGSLDGKIDITASADINTESNAFSAVTGNTDLDRRKRISSTSSSASSDLYSITLSVGGSLFQPTWSFESSPYLSDTNIYALILTGKTIDDFSGNDIAMESLLSPIFSSQLDTFISADQFKFLFSEGAAQFVYVKQITKALRIAAGVSIRGSEGNEQALSAEYYFNDRWFVDLTGQNTSDEEGKAPTFKLGARLHWHLVLD